MANRAPIATNHDGKWAADAEARTRLTSSPTRSHGVRSTGSFSYHGSQTPTFPLQALTEGEIRDSHRSRFLTEPEKILVSDPVKTRQSHRVLDSVTTQAGWHDQSIESVLQQLDVDAKLGLSDHEAERRRTQYGPNALEGGKRAPIWVIFMLQFVNLIIGLLMLAAVASIALQEYVEGLAIIAIVTLNAVIATMQENRAGNALDALAKMSSSQCVVIRDSRQTQIPSDALVPGDIVMLTTGDIVPADIRLITTSDCKVNEMILTGESEDVHKKFDADMSKSTKLTADNMVFASTSMACGNATGVVVETAMGTRVGSIAALLKDKHSSEGGNCISRFLAKYQPKMTPLQEALHHLGVFMGSAVLVICAIVFIVGMVRGNHDPKNADRPVWLTMVMVAVSLAVSAVPEGLPMVVTICLSTGTAEMVKKGVLVRKLAAVESLGAASVICTDKTGTLTEGKMTAIKAWGDFFEYAITGTGFDPNGEFLLNGVKQTSENNTQLHTMLLSAVLCSNTTLQQEQTEDGLVVWYPMGNASEAPLVVAAAKMGIWEADVSDKYPRVTEIPFNSSRKMMITLNQVTNPKLGKLALPQGTTYVANVKGAPNYILNNCQQFVRKSGKIVELSAKNRDAILEAVDELSSQALRVLAIAINPITNLTFAIDTDDIDEKFTQLSEPLIFVGLVASIDPPRQGVKESIKIARAASIRTVMITGDYLKTAIAIAKTIDLLSVGADVDEEAVDCSILRPRGDEYLTDHDLDEITSRTSVFARAKPEDKIEIVKSLQRQDHVAAMTGDGVNDAPALKEADIGVAMGIAGTEVAKGASDMILTDDNFCSIVAAVEKGRGIYTNIQKFVCFLLSTNFGEISIIFIAIAVGMPNPLEPLQILVLNLFADGMAAVALSLEKGDPRAMLERPRPKTQPIIHGRLWVLVLTNAFLIGSGALVVFSAGLYWNFHNVLMDDILNGAKTVDEYENVLCNRWQGVRAHWKLFGHCDALSADGSRIFPELPSGATGYEDSDFYCETGEYECLTEGIARAQTMAFIYITTMEMFRAYTARSFTNHVFVGFFSNKYMQYAAVGSISLTLFVTNTPVVMDDLFGFAKIYWFQWLFAMVVAFTAATLGEMLKFGYRRNDREKARWQNMDDGFDMVLLEIRNLRHHVEKLEDKLEVATHKPARRLTFLPGGVSRENSRNSFMPVPTPLQENMVYSQQAFWIFEKLRALSCFGSAGARVSYHLATRLLAAALSSGFMMKSSSFSSSSSTSSSASPSMNSSGSFASSHPDQTHSSMVGNEAQSSAFHGQAAAAGSGHEDGENESYERSFWANIFEEGSMVEHLLEGDEAMEEETKSSPSNGAHQTSLDGSEVDSTPSSALLDQWNHYDDSMDCSMAEFSAPQMTMASSTPSGSMLSQSTTYQHLMAGTGDHEVHRAYMKSGVAYNPHEQKLASGVASRSFTFDKQSDGTPFALSKPILRDDGIMLVGTEIADEPARTARDKNRIFVTNIFSSNPAQMAANIVIESEVRDLHWMNSQTAIAAIGKDIHLISIGAGGGNRSCHLQPAIPSVHSDAIRELAVHASSSHVLSGGFDETVVLTDLRRGGDPAASSIVSKFDAHDVVSSLRWSPDESQLSWTTDGGDFQIADARTRSSQLQIPLYTFLQVESMGGLFTHEYLSAHKVVLGFEHNHLVYVDTRMPRNACCYAVSKSPMIKTGEIRRSKLNKFALFGLGGFANADLSRNAKNQEVLKLRQYHQATHSAYKTSGDFSFESNNILAVSDNLGTVTLHNSDSFRAFDAGVHENWKEERTV